MLFWAKKGRTTRKTPSMRYAFILMLLVSCGQNEDFVTLPGASDNPTSRFADPDPDPDPDFNPEPVPVPESGTVCGADRILIEPIVSAADYAAALAAHPEMPDFRAHAPNDSRAPIPIFVITCDRLTVLKETIASFYRAIDRPIDLIIHDNHSTFLPMLAYLDALESLGITVVRHDQPADKVDMLSNVRESVDGWYCKHDSPYYAVTDPDIELQDGTGKILDFYSYLLDTHPEVNVVGPMLRTDDLPDYFPFKKDIIRGTLAEYGSRPSVYETFDGHQYRTIGGAIDTTFGLYRKSFGFSRLNYGIQAFPPFACRHLDFYLDPNNLAEDQIYYMKHASELSHVGGIWLREYIEKQTH
jgi:hypothetical protein